jgi:hypothetical protein
VKVKWCPGCLEEKHVGLFGRNKGRHDGLACYCLPCNARLVREHRIRTGKVKPGRKVGRPRKGAACKGG